MEIPQIVFEYLHCFLKHEPAPDEIKQLNETTLNDMYSFSKKHDLAHLLADILHKNSVWPDNSEIKKKFLQNSQKCSGG